MWNYQTFCCVTQSLIPPADNIDCHCCVSLLKTKMFSLFNRHFHSSIRFWSIHCVAHLSQTVYAVYFTVDVEQSCISVSEVSFRVLLQLENHSDTHCTYSDASIKILWTFSYRILEKQEFPSNTTATGTHQAPI